MINIKESFDKHNTEYAKFDRIGSKVTQRSDLYAFILLDKLCPSTNDIVSCSEHDEITLNIDPAKLANVATEEDVVTLIRCGVRYDKSDDCFRMFV